jgi:hypothetical protein
VPHQRPVLSSGYSGANRFLCGFASALLADLFARRSYCPSTPRDSAPITPAADLSALRVRLA